MLLLHGASANSGTFLWPDPASEVLGVGRFAEGAHGPSLATYLCDLGFDVWLLDWRGSNRVVRHGLVSGTSYALDAVALQDIPWALGRIFATRPGLTRLHLMGHCVGAMALAMSIGAGATESSM